VETVSVDAPIPQSAAVRLRQRLCFLELLRERVREREFTPRLSYLVGRYCGESASWRIPLIVSFVSRFADPQPRRTPPDESDYQKLSGWIEEEVRSVREELAQAEQEEAREASAARDACLASGGEAWALLLRQESALDRTIDRKVRILMCLRDRYEKKAASRSRSANQSEFGLRESPQASGKESSVLGTNAS
jgi:hypothetical protein